MNNINDPKYKEKIVRKITTIEDAFDGLTENEISAAVCAATTKVLVDRGLCAIQIKRFYAELAANAIEKADISLMIYKRFKDDTN